MDMVVVGTWTGQETKALRLALRMTIEDFAEHLGVAARTVAKWEARGCSIVPLATIQEALDTALERATPEQQARFDVLRHESQPGPGVHLGSTSASEDLHDGLNCSGSLDGTLRAVVELSGRDMNRRDFMRASAFMVAAFSEPALLSLTLPPAESTARESGRRIGLADVEVLTEHIAHLRRLDNRYGSGQVREQVVQLLHRGANTILHSTYSEKTGKALLSAIAQASWLAGATAADIGRHSLAQRYYIQALNLAMSTGDRLYAAKALSDMSRLTLHTGQHRATTRRDLARHARHAIALARAGLSVSHGHDTPALAALLYAAEARGQSLLGDAEATRQAVLEAERLHERSRPDGEPPWLSFYSAAVLAADLGRCLRDIGEADQAAALIRSAMDGYESWGVRSRCFAQTDLAATHIVAGELEQAATLGRDALHTAVDVSSTHTIDRIRTLQRQIRPHLTGSTHLAELDERITDFFTRSG